MRDQLKRFAVVAAVVLAAAGARNGGAVAQQTTLADKAQQSIVYIWFDVTEPTTGAKSIVQGTGFIVSKSGYVLTASHLFRDWGKQTDADRNQNAIRGSPRGKPGDVIESPLILRIINPGNIEYEDVALLKLPSVAQGFSAASVCLQDANLARVGDSVVAYGFPQDQSFQPVEGMLGTTNAPGGRFAAAAAFTYGMSGGPVYSKQGHVIGLIRGGFPGVSTVNWITPIRHAISMLQQAGYEEDCGNGPILEVGKNEGPPPPPVTQSGWPIKFEDVKYAELRLYDVDDFMTVSVNDHEVATATYRHPTDWHNIMAFLHRGMNVVEIAIRNGELGGCGGSLEVNLNGAKRDWTWFNHQDQPPNKLCFQETGTIELR
jgi:hypothetical protein